MACSVAAAAAAAIACCNEPHQQSIGPADTRSNRVATTFLGPVNRTITAYITTLASIRLTEIDRKSALQT